MELFHDFVINRIVLARVNRMDNIMKAFGWDACWQIVVF